MGFIGKVVLNQESLPRIWGFARLILLPFPVFSALMRECLRPHEMAAAVLAERKAGVKICPLRFLGIP